MPNRRSTIASKKSDGFSVSDFLASSLDDFPGGITRVEVPALAMYAARAKRGALVQVGGELGKSALSMIFGLVSGQGDAERMLYCVDEQAHLAGKTIQDASDGNRKHFFDVIVKCGLYHLLRLVNQPSATAARTWSEEISLLYIVGHRPHALVQADIKAWCGNLRGGAILALDDTGTPGTGSRQCVNELIGSGVFKLRETIGNISFLQKKRQLMRQTRSIGSKRFLVFYEASEISGGLLRFTHLERELRARGHTLTMAFSGVERPNFWGSDVELIHLDEAAEQTWDVTMLPGAGFTPKGLELMGRFRDERYGLRVQHILNSAALAGMRGRFKRVNDAFAPNVVIFNNRHWAPGSYTDYQADRFYTIEGAVDTSRFAPQPLRALKGAQDKIVLAGQAHKNPMPLVAALEHLPERFELELFGRVTAQLEKARPMIASGRVRILDSVAHDDMPERFHSWDAIVHTELYAGWAGMVAESMASGVPVLCTRAGTLPLAENEHTALVLEEASPEHIAQGVRRLFGEAGLAQHLTRNARVRATELNWSKYTDQTLTALFEDEGFHYVHAPEMGLHGKWPIAHRLHGLEPLLNKVAGKRILDLGCAEGIIAQNCLENGARSVLGFEIDAGRVARAAELCGGFDSADFFVQDLSTWSKIHANHGQRLDQGFDILLHLGVQHHLPAHNRRALFTRLLERTRELVVLRCMGPVYRGDKLRTLAETAGFELVLHSPTSPEAPFGDIWYFHRVRAIQQRSEPKASVFRNRYFVSYPKSGRTWVRYALSTQNKDQDVRWEHDGFEFNDGAKPPHCFDIERRRRRLADAQVVYLERDPRDIMVSLYHQVTGRFKDFFDYSADIGTFIRDDYFGAHNLQAFREMWDQLCAEGLATKLTYEDCHLDFEKQLVRLSDHLDLDLSAEQIAAAEQAARIDEMRAVEERGSFPKPWMRKRNGHTKVRKGVVGGFAQVLDAEDLAYLNSVFGVE